MSGSGSFLFKGGNGICRLSLLITLLFKEVFKEESSMQMLASS